MSQLSHLYSRVAQKNAAKAEEIFFGIFGAFMELGKTKAKLTKKKLLYISFNYLII